MASPETLDFETLLRPISEENPGGCELRDDSEGRQLFFQVKEAREAARTIERRLQHGLVDETEDTGTLERPDWQIVQTLAIKILSEYSKDLWVCAWLTEAMTRLEGFAGLRDSFRLTREISENFWEQIHPVPDEDGYATTVAQLVGLNGEDADGALIAAIEGVPIVCATSLDPLSSADYRDAVDMGRADPEQRERRIEQGAVTLEMFEKAVREAPSEYFCELLEDIEAAEDEFSRLSTKLDDCCGTDDSGYALAPPSSNIRNSLAEVRERVRAIARDHLAKGDVADGETSSQLVAESPAAEGTVVGANSAVLNREDAFRALLKVADFFHRTEPHSPVSYALEQAVRWGRMSLPDLMKDLISDDSVRQEMFKRLGIPDSEYSSED
ncbi:MAG: type VI secretion system protein TssA [Planctomycetales bacterium]|nr:type VI secretion system protein TssA [Planctomycetales bacterium]